MTREIDSDRLIRPAQFAHFVLRTRNLEESARWYELVVGMQAVVQNSFIAFMTYDEEHHRLALVATPEQAPVPPAAVGLDHVAYSLHDLGELLGTYERLKAKGILPVFSVNHGPTTSLYYADPDGNRVEFQVDNFDTEAETKGWFGSEAFAKNPIGVEFDPEVLAMRYRRGDSIEELKQQGATVEDSERTEA